MPSTVQFSYIIYWMCTKFIYMSLQYYKFQMTLPPYLTGKASELPKWLHSFQAGKTDVPLSVNSILSNVLVVFSMKINIKFHEKKAFQKGFWNWEASDVCRCSSLRKHYNACQVCRRRFHILWRQMTWELFLNFRF